MVVYGPITPPSELLGETYQWRQRPSRVGEWLSGTPGSTPSWRIEALKTEHFYLALTDANFQTVGHFARFPEQCLL